MPIAQSNITCSRCTKMLRILNIFRLNSQEVLDLLGEGKGKNVIMRSVCVFLLSRVCNFFFLLLAN